MCGQECRREMNTFSIETLATNEKKSDHRIRVKG